MLIDKRSIVCVSLLAPTLAAAGSATEFCLDGEFDLGARYQGTRPESGEFYASTWCVLTEDDSNRVLFSAEGQSNPDIKSTWMVAYLPPDTVRIVNRDAPPDIEFQGTDNIMEALRIRRIDPRRFAQEYESKPETLKGIEVDVRDGKLRSAAMSAEMPFRGHVEVIWEWNWRNEDSPTLELVVDRTTLFKAKGRWRTVRDDEVARAWQPTPGAAAVEVPGNSWPAKIDMRRIQLTDDVFLVRGVRTGFQHLVVRTGDGMVIADAPAGWVQFNHIPPSDLVPGLGVSGLSERLIDFLKHEFPNEVIRAVVLTHFHDDHAGGARAFAAEGAEIFAPAASADFIANALNREPMPPDRWGERQHPINVISVAETLTIGGEPNRVRLVPMGANPHVYAMLGVWAIDKDLFFVSDVHVPHTDEAIPRQARALTECWFADWAVKNLAPEVKVLNSHSSEITPVSRLARYLDTDMCLSRQR
jgi:glyoxylase-like metal-dependent hydrolase (beta-lactamase superfamily II)